MFLHTDIHFLGKYGSFSNSSIDQSHCAQIQVYFVKTYAYNTIDQATN